MNIFSKKLLVFQLLFFLPAIVFSVSLFKQISNLKVASFEVAAANNCCGDPTYNNGRGGQCYDQAQYEAGFAACSAGACAGCPISNPGGSCNNNGCCEAGESHSNCGNDCNPNGSSRSCGPVNTPPPASTICSPLSPTASSCSNGNALGSSCTGFPGTCTYGAGGASNVDAQGRPYCACVANTTATCAQVGGSCYAGSSCAQVGRNPIEGNASCSTGQVCCAPGPADNTLKCCRVGNSYSFKAQTECTVELQGTIVADNLCQVNTTTCGVGSDSTCLGKNINNSCRTVLDQSYSCQFKSGNSGACDCAPTFNICTPPQTTTYIHPGSTCIGEYGNILGGTCIGKELGQGCQQAAFCGMSAGVCATQNGNTGSVYSCTCIAGPVTTVPNPGGGSGGGDNGGGTGGGDNGGGSGGGDNGGGTGTTPTPTPPLIPPTADCAVCQYQLDVFWGPVIETFLGGVRYSYPSPKRLIAAAIDKMDPVSEGISCSLNTVAATPYELPAITDPSPACADPVTRGFLKATIDRSQITQATTDSTVGSRWASATITNTTSDCTYEVGFAAYKANWTNRDQQRITYDEIENQNLFDVRTRTIQPGETLTLDVRVPTVDSVAACY